MRCRLGGGRISAIAERYEMKKTQGGYSFELRHYVLGLAVLWTLVCAVLLAWDLSQIHRTTLDLAIQEARANFNKDQAFRHWASRHGGVYVPVTANTPPNPYLAHVPERDLRTSSGRELTLMNPAYMVRQLNEQFADWFGARGHITSLKVLRPGNDPDPWERTALLAFETGVKEVRAFAEINGEPFLRLMEPMVAQKQCLKCHAKQGYKEGDVRGGVSVSIPMQGHLARERRSMIRDAASFGTLWLLGLAVILLGGRALERRDLSRLQAEGALRRANADLTEYARVASHQLQEPLRQIFSYTQLLGRRYRGRLDADADEYIRYASEGAQRMQRLIGDLLAYSHLGSTPPKAEVLDPRRVLDQVLAASKERIEGQGAQIHVGTLPAVRMEARHLELLLAQLLDNALAFPGEEPLKIRVEARQEGGEWRLSVRDNGIGIDFRHHKRIFRLFERLSGQPEHGGTGIGLALCLKLVELYGGRIEVESAPAQGADFQVSLPVEKVGPLETNTT